MGTDIMDKETIGNVRFKDIVILLILIYRVQKKKVYKFCYSSQ